MTDIEKIFALIQRIRRKYPDMQIGQILENAQILENTSTNLFFISDKELIFSLTELAEYYER